MNERALRDALATIGYSYVSPLTYTHESGNDEVEHFLFFSIFGHGSEKKITVDFGLLNKAAQKFAQRMLLRYGGKLYESLRGTIEENSCFMRFSVWRLLDSKAETYWPLGHEKTHQQITSAIYPRLSSFLSSVRDKQGLFQLLADDREPCPWFVVNGAARAAELAILAAQLGVDIVTLKRLFELKRSLILSNLSNEIDVERYSHSIIQEAGL